MPKSKKKSRSWLKPTLIVAGIMLVSYGIFRLFAPTPQSADIFVISQPLEYGDVTLTGTLRKDTPIGQAGNYYLVLKSGATIALDAQGLDGLTNASVTATGFLSPANGAVYPTMAVSTIEIATN